MEFVLWVTYVDKTAVVQLAVTELEEEKESNGFRQEVFELEIHLCLAADTCVLFYD